MEILAFLSIIEQMCGIPSGNGRSIEKTCAEFGASQGTIARYLRIYQLLPELRNLMDQEKIPLRAGVELSWLSTGMQKMILAILIEKGKRISEHQAVSLRKQADTLDEAAIRKILCGEDRAKPYSFTVSSSIIAQYFQPNTRKKEISAIMEKALKMYFESISEDKETSMFIPCEFSDRQYHRALRPRTGQTYGIGLPGPHETAVCEKFGRCAGYPYPKHGKNPDGQGAWG